MKFIIGTGFFHGHTVEQKFDAYRFASLWYQNLVTRKEMDFEEYTNVYVTSVGDCEFPVYSIRIRNIPISGNLGHVGQLLNGEKPYSLCGWSASILTLALIAYQAQRDFIYKEADCLAFGDWITKMYEELGDGQMIFGKKHTSPPYMACSQSLFLIKHAFIPTFIAEYLALGTDANPEMLPETKFWKIEEKFGGEKIKRLSFGCDRERPIPYDDPVFYVQHLTDLELAELKKRGLI